MKTQLKKIKEEVFGEDYIDSAADEPGSPEPKSPGLSSKRTFRAPKEDEV